MNASPGPRHLAGKHRYTSVVDGIALANDFARSRQSMSAFARQRGVTIEQITSLLSEVIPRVLHRPATMSA